VCACVCGQHTPCLCVMHACRMACKTCDVGGSPLGHLQLSSHPYRLYTFLPFGPTAPHGLHARNLWVMTVLWTLNKALLSSKLQRATASPACCRLSPSPSTGGSSVTPCTILHTPHPLPPTLAVHDCSLLQCQGLLPQGAASVEQQVATLCWRAGRIRTRHTGTACDNTHGLVIWVQRVERSSVKICRKHEGGQHSV